MVALGSYVSRRRFSSVLQLQFSPSQDEGHTTTFQKANQTIMQSSSDKGHKLMPGVMYKYASVATIQSNGKRSCAVGGVVCPMRHPTN